MVFVLLNKKNSGRFDPVRCYREWNAIYKLIVWFLDNSLILNYSPIYNYSL